MNDCQEEQPFENHCKSLNHACYSDHSSYVLDDRAEVLIKKRLKAAAVP